MEDYKLSDEEITKANESFERYRREDEKRCREAIAEGIMCANCHSYYVNKNAKYCVHCGTKKGEGQFNSVWNMGELIYGPEYLSFFKCKKCGHKWSVVTMYTGDEDPMVAYCPNCGTKRIKMYYEDSDPNAINAGTKDITVQDIVKYKIRKIRSCFYSIKRRIIERYNNNNYEK